MGQKVNPIGFRIGVNKTWKSRWYENPKDYADILLEDLKIRDFINKNKEAQSAEVCDIEIIRQPQKVTVILQTARPGVLIGQKGTTIEVLSSQLSILTSKKVQIKIKEIKKPDANAQLVAIGVAKQLKGRAAYRKVLKNAIQKSMQAGVLGIKIKVSGRLGGAEMARSEQLKEGRIPLHTLRSDIDYGFAEADTTYGKIGVKVWLFNGFIFDKDIKEDAGEVVKAEKQHRRQKDA